MTTTAVRYHSHGKPDQVLRVESLPLPEPGPGEVRLALRAATINPSDLGMIAGSYGRLPELPAVAGREGVGMVEAVGEGVTNLAPGDLTQMPEDQGVWQSHVIARAEKLTMVPAGIDPAQATMAFINPPTALLILEEFVDLQPGDWVIQNAANSIVGHALIAIAHERGLKTLNVVRDVAKWEKPLLDLGATLVEAEDSGYEKRIEDLCHGQRPKLALNSVGGMSVVRLIRSLADGGTCVTIGGAVGDEIRYPTRDLIFRDVRLRGFWMDRWGRTNSPERLQAVQNRIFAMLAEQKLVLPVGERFPLSKAVAAIAASLQGHRNGKVLLTSEE